MAIQIIPGGLWIPPAFVSSGSAPTIGASATVLNAAANQFAIVFRVPKTGTLDWFEYRQANNTVAPTNGLRFAFQNVNATNDPDNTDDEFAVVTAGFGLGAWLVPPGYMGAGGTGTGAKRSVTKGDWIACVIKFESFVAGDNVSMSAFTTPTAAAECYDPQLRYILGSTNSGVTWAKASASNAAIALRYDDGSYAEISWPWLPILNINTITFNSGSTPDEHGLLFQIPFPARISGMWFRGDLDGAADIILYDTSDNVIASYSLVPGYRVISNGANFKVDFPTPVNLSANSNYRLTILPTSVTNLSIYDFDIASSNLLQSIDGGATWMSTQRTDAGAWTNVNTNRPFMGIILDGFDDAASGGGGEHSAVF